jgi:hypothetical protein
MYEIRTSSYIKSKKILLDGNEWTMTAPGAGDELALGQAQRRSQMLQKKIEAGTASEADYDLYDKLEASMFKLFSKIFRDGTTNNTQVDKWLNSTPMIVINAIMEDIKTQAEAKEAEDGNSEIS